jgi:hypothetical protein
MTSLDSTSEKGPDERQFRHRPLQPDRPQIRLIKLLPCDKWKKIQVQCELETFEFDSKPQYSALSYTWGVGALDQKIYINGEAFFVSENLYSFFEATLLYHWDGDVFGSSLIAKPPCGFNGKGYLWVDQICVDQSESAVNERNEQVARMDRVYMDADTVYAWLGDGDDEVREVIRLTHNMTNRRFSYKNDYNVMALQGVLYWKRAWVVQEMALARKLVFMYCKEAATSEELQIMLKNNYYLRPDINLKVDGLVFSNFLRMLDGMMIRDFQNDADLSVLPDTMLMYQDCKLTHDKIYAFQNLLPQRARVEVNYGWTKVQLFAALMDKLATTTRNKGFFVIEPFANCLNILPEDFATTLRLLNTKVWTVDEDIICDKERRYELWAPRLNPACRGSETAWKRFQMACWDSVAAFGGASKPRYPGLWIGDPWNSSLDGWLALCLCGKTRNSMTDCSCGYTKKEKEMWGKYEWMKLDPVKIITPLFSSRAR